MKNKPEQIIKITDSKIDKIVLGEDIINHIHNYTKGILKVGLEEIYKILNDIEILRNIPLVDPIYFEKICKSDFDDQDFVNSLIALNAILKSDDIESLETCELYQNVLNGRIYTKPTSTAESLNIIHAMRAIILSDYEEIINTLEVKCSGDNSSDSCDLSNQ